MTRALDKVKSKVFLGDNSAFLGSLMCSMQFSWNEHIETAQTDGITIEWNPNWFLSLPEPTRVTVLKHELWHVARMHMLRSDNKDPKIWNYACLAGDSLIAMADGTSKPINEVASGDLIKNVKNGTSAIAVRINSGVKELLEITYESGRTLKCTPEHKVLTENGFKNAAQLTKGISCFVDSRFNQTAEGSLGNKNYPRNSRFIKYEVSPSRIKSLHNRINKICKTINYFITHALTNRSRMGLSSWTDRRRRNHNNYEQNGKRKTVSSTQNAHIKYLPPHERLASSKRIWSNFKRKQQGMLVFFNAHSTNTFKGVLRKITTLVSHQAAFSNFRTALDGNTAIASFQVLSDARDAKNSQRNLHLEYDRIVQIRKLPAEETYDLVTSDHHFLANGVVVHNCDIRINNDLLKEGSSFDGTSPMINPSVDDYGILAEEQIYELLVKDKNQIPQNGAGGTWGTGEDDLKADDPTAAKQSATIVGNVVRAVQQAELANKAGEGTGVGNIKELLNTFLNPIVPWERLLMEYFTQLNEPELSWKRPNRRYTEIYMPSNVEANNGLEDLRYYLDVSGSISRADIIRFNSELKYVLEILKPKKLTVVQFDWVIQQEDVFTSDVRFNGLNVYGRGGTCLECVREDIIKHKPTAAVIFSDLDVKPMAKLPKDIPVIWVAVDSHRLRTPSFGKLIKIPKEKS